MNQSYVLRDRLKEHWKVRCRSLHPIAEGVHPLPVVGVEPLHAVLVHEDEYGVVEKQPAYESEPPMSSKPQRDKAPPERIDYLEGLRGNPNPEDGRELTCAAGRELLLR